MNISGSAAFVGHANRRGVPKAASVVQITYGPQFSLLTVQAGTAGTYPYSATVLPLIGAIPAGSWVGSVDDANMRSSILSTHSDGSASVVVVSGSMTVTLNQARTIALNPATGSTGTPLTSSAVSSLVTNVSVAFGGTYGTASISSFGSPEKTWWANNQVICARYRVAAPTPGTTSLEAVIDIHAYSGRALVEVVVENGKMTTATPTKPTAASYTGAVVTVNGSTIATVNGNLAPEGNHAAFRSWYASTWVGGNPGLRATQLYTDLQKHPLLFTVDQANTASLTGYASDAYAAWTTGRQRAVSMGAGGDHQSIGALPQWEAQFLQTGDYRTANATEVSALACLGWSINYRDSAGAIPTFTQLKAISATQQAGWPSQGNATDAMTWEVAHHPAAGLMAFVSRPSPVFIELAQKVAVWNGTWSSSNDYGSPTTTGVFGQYYQVRGRAWCLRSLAHAAFLTPDGDAWKTPAKTSISDNVTYLDQWRTDSKYSLGVMCDSTFDHPEDHRSDLAGFQQAIWEHHYLVPEVHKVTQIGLLSGGSQTALATLADWCALQPVQWVNQQPNGGWRYIAYKTTLGNNAVTINSAATWAAQRALDLSDTPPTVAGTWFTAGDVRASYSVHDVVTSATPDYPTYFWTALVAAVERGVTGSALAWTTVINNVTTLAAWRTGFATDPRWGAYPKTVPSWTATLVNDTWVSLGANYRSWASTGIPTLSYIGSDPKGSPVDAFCDPAFDGSAQYFFGGGHAAGTCNAVVKFDHTTLTYSLVGQPTNPSFYPPGYGTSAAVLNYPSGFPFEVGNFDAPGSTGWFLTATELTSPTDAAYRAPAVARLATHMYGAAVSRGTKVHYFYLTYGEFDTATGLWSGRGTDLGAQLFAIQANLGNYALQQGTMGAYDATTDRMYVTLCAGDSANYNRAHIIQFNPNTRTIDAIYPAPSFMSESASICIAGRKLFIFTKIGAYGDPAVMNQGFYFDMDAKVFKSFTLSGITTGTTMSFTTTQETIPAYYDGIAIRRWNFETAYKNKIYSIIPTPVSGAGTTGSPYVFAQTERTITGAPTAGLVYTRLVYNAAAGAAMVLPAADSGWYALKLS